MQPNGLCFRHLYIVICTVFMITTFTLLLSVFYYYYKRINLTYSKVYNIYIHTLLYLLFIVSTYCTYILSVYIRMRLLGHVRGVLHQCIR